MARREVSFMTFVTRVVVAAVKVIREVFAGRQNKTQG
jgi:hypothetical protein